MIFWEFHKMIKENLDLLRMKILAAARRTARDPNTVRIVAAAKSQSRDFAEQAIREGVTLIGHNYVQEAVRESSESDAGPLEIT